MPAPDQTVRTTERLWSEEVGLARAAEGPQNDKVEVYEWSNQRRFFDGYGGYSNNAVDE